MPNRTRGQIELLILIGVVLVISFFLGGGLFGPSVPNTAPITTIYTPITQPPGPAGDQLKLNQLQFSAITVTPAPTTTVVTPTPPALACSGKNIAVDLLLDTSGSMGVGNNIGKLITAVTRFGTKFKAVDVVGIQSFSGVLISQTDIPLCYKLGINLPACELLPLNIFNLPTYNDAVSKLAAGGVTHMLDGFTLAQQKINEARPKFPDYAWYLIFLTDGVPNDGRVPGALNEEQNPSLVAQQIKNSGITVISIGLSLNAVDSATGVPGASQYARNLLTNVASPNPLGDPLISPTYFYESNTGDDLDRVFDAIALATCR